MDTITPDISASPPDADMRPLAEILETLSRVRQPFPETAMQAAIARREEITPPLLEALRRLVHNPKWNAGDCLWFYGVHLLAQFREPAAYEPLLEICRWPTKDIDTVLEDAGRIHRLSMTTSCLRELPSPPRRCIFASCCHC